MTVSLDVGEEFSDDIFQAGQITASPSTSEAEGGSEVIEDIFIDLYHANRGKNTHLVPGSNKFTEYKIVGDAVLVSAPPMYHSLAAYLAPP